MMAYYNNAVSPDLTNSGVRNFALKYGQTDGYARYLKKYHEKNDKLYAGL
jgi:hypothetical protein